MTSLPASPLAELKTLQLASGSEALLQRFLDANPLYFLAVAGEPAQPTEAHEEINDPLPKGWAYTKKWVFGFAGASGELAAMAHVVSDLIAHNVWHISTFIVETARHGNGDARVLYEGIESWARSNGAQWLRLGVVKGHRRAERFWERQGFQQTRERSGVVMGQRSNTLRVMCKPLAGGSIDDYLALIERDRPESSAA